MNLFTKKPLDRLIAESEGIGEKGGSLRRTLSATSLVALGIGAIIGAGIFSITGVAAATHAGPALVYSFILAAFGCTFAGFCYSEFSTMIPIAGSAYTYAYATVGELVAWIIGWALVLEYAVGAATVAVSWSATTASILADFNIHIPQAVLGSPFDLMPGVVNLLAVVVVVVISAILIIGVQESARFNAVIVFVKVAVVVVFIIVGYFYINKANYTPFLPANTTGKFGAFGWSGVLAGAGQIFFAYIGFDAVSTAAQEAKNPGRDMPIGIIGSLGVCTVLYILYSLVLTGVVN
jgi:basic amino acid/polyamine antiporter, APA family